jgi:hypothetical protein
MAEQPIEMRFHGSTSYVELASDFGVITALQEQLDNLRGRTLLGGVSMLERATWRKHHQRLSLHDHCLIVVLPCQPIECCSANAQQTCC